jgi:hypothetical protein
MADDKTKVRPQDSNRVNVNEDYELQYWSEKFGVSREQLKSAVQQVGPIASDVVTHLRGHSGSGFTGSK